MWFAFFLLAFGDPIVWEQSNDDFSAFIADFRRVVVTEHEELYVLDREDQHIYHLDASGKELKRFSRKGEGPGEMSGASLLQYHPALETLFVWDWSKPQLHAFSLAGKSLPSSIPSKNYPIVIAKDQIAYIHDPAMEEGSDAKTGATIVLENLTTKEKTTLSTNDASRHQGPGKVGGANGLAVVSFEWYAKSLLKGSPDGQQLVMGSNMAIDFHIYDVALRKVKARIKAKNEVRYPLTEEEIDAKVMRIQVGGKVYTSKDFEHPDFKPPVDRIFMDTEGRVWVALQTAWQAKHRRHRVFSADGAEVGQLQLGVHHRIVHADKTHLWVSRHDRKEDVWYLQKRTYQLER